MSDKATDHPDPDCEDEWHGNDDTAAQCPNCGETEKDGELEQPTPELVAAMQERLNQAQAEGDLDGAPTAEGPAGDGPLFNPDEIEQLDNRPPWVTDPPPRLTKPRWPQDKRSGSYARSASWLTKLFMCLLRHAEIYRRRNKETMGYEAQVGTAVHDVLAWAAVRRIRGMYRGQIPTWAGTAELLNLLEHQEQARRDPKVLVEARELIEGMGQVSFRGAIQAEGLVQYRAEGILLAGYADLIRVEGDPKDPDEVEVIDYKTGGKVPTEAELALDPQACLYAIAGRRMFPRARRVTFKLWNVREHQWRVVPYSRRLEANFHAMVRAASISWAEKDETPSPGAHCDHCHVRSSCGAYAKMVREAQTKPHPSDLAALGLEEQIRLYRQMHVLLKMCERRKSDLAALIEASIPEDQRSYRAGRLQVVRQRESYTAWDGVGEAVVEIAAETGQPVSTLIEEITKGIGTQKLSGFLKSLPDEMRQRAERVVERRSNKGYTGSHIQVRELKGKAAF